jgi:hypothetical protein
MTRGNDAHHHRIQLITHRKISEESSELIVWKRRSEVESDDVRDGNAKVM